MNIIDIHSHMTKDDPTMDGYVANMDSANVEWALLHGLPGRGLDNEAILQAVKRHRDRLAGGVYVDLRQPVPDCVGTVKRYADEGFRCVKLFPNVGYDPNDEALEPFWQAVEEMQLMVLSHCGWLGIEEGKGEPRVSSLTATPAHFEIPARRHLSVPFIMAHFGGAENYLQTLVYTSRLPNMYADVAPGWGRWVFEHELSGLSGVTYSHLLYASDNPHRPYGEDIAWWEQKLKAMGCSDEELRLFFYDNAARLLKGE